MNPADDANSRLHAPRSRRQMAGEFARFVVVGFANTLVAYAVYLLLLTWMRYEFAYTIGYAAGILVAYVLSTSFVFRQPMRARSASLFPLVYAAQYLVSLGILHVAVEIAHIPQWLALGVSIVATIPVTFALSRWVVRSN